MSNDLISAWRQEGRDLIDWMNNEANDMARVERDVAITRTTGGSAAIAGGVLTGVGIVASFFTFGLAAPLAVAGVALSGAGAATSVGGDVAQVSILHTKTREIKTRCESFGQRTEDLLGIVQGIVYELWKHSSSNIIEDVIDTDQIVVITTGKGAMKLATRGIDAAKIAIILKSLTKLKKSGVDLGADCLKIVGGKLTGSGLRISRSVWKGAGAAVGIGFGIWDVVDGAGTLKNGGSHASLIRDNARQISNTIQEIDSILRTLGF